MNDYEAKQEQRRQRLEAAPRARTPRPKRRAPGPTRSPARSLQASRS
jgi:hypothetical protein